MDAKLIDFVKGIVEPGMWDSCTMESPCEMRGELLIASTMNVGEQVVMQRGGSEARYKATLCGWTPGKKVFLGVGRTLLMSGHLGMDTPLILRYVSLGLLCGFKAVVETILVDNDLAILTWPEKLEVACLAKEHRVRVRLPGTLYSQGAEEKQTVLIDALVVDLSPSGCKVCLPRDPTLSWLGTPENEVGISFPFTLSKETLSLQGKVRNWQSTSAYNVLGVLFNEASRLDGQKLAGLLSEHSL